MLRVAIAISIAALGAPLGCSHPASGSAAIEPGPASPSAGTARVTVSETSSAATRPAAPSLDGATAWLGVDQPVSLEELKGHVVVLDFWTYCCVNCLHTLPELKALEGRFADDPVVFLGVHSGKFEAEKDVERIQLAMRRHGIEHPVAVDSESSIWDRYGVGAWPTLVVIDSRGRFVAMSAGEPDRERVAALVERLLEEGRATGALAKSPRRFTGLESGSAGPLSFPGKLAVARDGRIAVSDTSHHRILVLDGGGRLLTEVGSGLEGLRDGGLGEAAFRRPQGVAFSGDGRTLYVADTENHAVRAVDLDSQRVRTIAGTGDKGQGRSDGGPARSVDLRSPWDVVERPGGELLVAMAGSHQVWTIDTARETARPIAGTGREDIADGPLKEALFSQPSGLALAGDSLFVADAEVSAVRAVDLAAGRVETLVGTGLFDFGDVDGIGKQAKLQHPLGVAARRGELFVADSYNDKVKRVDLTTGAVSTVAGGARDALFEPGDVEILPDGRLLVADTNGHRLRTVNPKNGAIDDFPLKGVSPPAVRGVAISPAAEPSAAEGSAREPAKASGRLGEGRGTIYVEISPPKGGKLTEGAPFELKASGPGLTLPPPVKRRYAKGVLPVKLPVTVRPGASGTLDLDVSYYWCESGDTASCHPAKKSLRVSIDLSGPGPGGEATVTVR